MQSINQFIHFRHKTIFDLHKTNNAIKIYAQKNKNNILIAGTPPQLESSLSIQK